MDIIDWEGNNIYLFIFAARAEREGGNNMVEVEVNIKMIIQEVAEECWMIRKKPAHEE